MYIIFRMFVLIFLITLSQIQLALAQDIIRLDPSLGEVQVGKSLETLVDPDHRLDISAVQKQENWVPAMGEVPNFKYTDAAIWARAKISNDEIDPTEWLFELAAPMLDSIEFFELSGAEILSKRVAGDWLRYSEREIDYRHPVFVVSLDAKETKTIYIRIVSQGAVSIPLTAQTSEVFTSKKIREQFTQGIYAGFMIVMVLYNLFLFISLRDVSYLFYILYILSFSLNWFGLIGINFKYLWPESIWWANTSIPFFIGSTSIWLMLFAMNYLKVKMLPGWFWKLCLFYVGVLILGAIHPFILPYQASIQLNILGSATGIIVLTAATIWSLIRGERSAKFFGIAFAVFFTGILAYILRVFDILPDNFVTEHSKQIGSAMEVVLLSIGLGDRINQERRQRYLAQKEALDNEIKAKAAQEEAIRNLMEADQLKNDIMANTSHELRTPLNGIIGITESILAGKLGDINEDVKENLWFVTTSGKRLLVLINDILDFSKLRDNEIEISKGNVWLGDTVKLVLGLLKPLAMQKNLTMQNEIPNDLPPALGDEVRIEQVFHNLIGNAIKFTQEGRIFVRAQVVGEMIQVEVSDTGIGIREDQIPKIFESFQQADGSISREFGGTGLGLAVTKSIIAMHGGDIEVDSTPGKGSTFRFRLPRSHEATSETKRPEGKTFDEMAIISTENNSSQASDNPENLPSVLVVDDESLNLQVLKNQFRGEAFHVVFLQDPSQVINELESQKFDIVLLDVMMPKIHGYELARMIREKWSSIDLPIIFLTAKNQSSDVVEGFSSGGNDYISKPFKQEELLARTRNHLQLKELTVRVSQESEAKARLEKDLEAAEAVQETLFSIPSELAHLKLDIHYKCAERVGGDWYGEFYDRENQVVYVLLGDVTGHGVSSALFTGLVAGAARSFFDGLFKQETSPVENNLMMLSELLNRVLYESSQRSGRMMSMLMMALDFQHRKVSFLSNGHPSPICVRDGSTRIINLRGDWLGSSPKTASRIATEEFQSSDSYFLYTDGLLENTGPEQETLTKRKLRQILEEAASEHGPDSIKSVLLDHANRIWKSHPAADDVTFIVASISMNN